MELKNTYYKKRLVNSSKKFFKSESFSSRKSSSDFRTDKYKFGRLGSMTKTNLPPNRINMAKSSNPKTMLSMMTIRYGKTKKQDHVLNDHQLKNTTIRIKNQGRDLASFREPQAKMSENIPESSPFDTAAVLPKGKNRIRTIGAAVGNLNGNRRKQFKKQIILPNTPSKRHTKERNSLSNFFLLDQKANKFLFESQDCRAMQNSNIMKISKIEFQVKGHCLQKKKLGKTMSNISADKLGLTEKMPNVCSKSRLLGEEIKEEERTTRNTSITSCRPSQNLVKEPEISSIQAEVDLEDKKESFLEETGISERILTKTFNVYGSNSHKITGENKSYGCSCGKATDPTLNGCIRAEEWLKYAFNGFSKSFSHKDQKVFQELVDTKVKNELSAEVENDDRIPITVCIENDLTRTFPTEEYYKPPEAKQTLFNVLKAYTLYDTKCGYVQGMNFIAASLLYHCSPDIAFWLLVSLMFDYNLRDNYEAGFTGIEDINAEISRLIAKNCPKLNKLFKETETDLSIFSFEVIMTLFGTAIPLSATGDFYDNFFKEGWNFFAKLIITFLSKLQKPLLKESDPWSIISIIKAHASPASNSNRSAEIPLVPLDWPALIKTASTMK
ncbi:unnamed protein product [Moneuplotes crassus]|uniref:Rab-GAP TBC domain-containing protein n=1 Tax=Euplotes crassus TaxID=5936 RepID=A0AAD1U0F6_EUPCR|nr:unnamed protein product [Moneuplotes crassus]